MWNDKLGHKKLDAIVIRTKEKVIVRDYKYIACKSYKSSALNFRGWNALTDYTPTGTDNLQYIRNPMRKLYFDIDKVNIPLQEFNDHIHTFIDTLNKALNPKNVVHLTIDDFQIHTKTRDNHIISIHVIAKRHSMDRTEQMSLAINLTTVDIKIYDKGRAFYNCFNGKYGKETFDYHECNTDEYSLIWIDEPDENSMVLVYTLPPTAIQKIEHENPIEYYITNKDRYLSDGYNWMLLMSYVRENCIMSREDFCKITIVKTYKYEDNLHEWDNCTYEPPRTEKELTMKLSRYTFYKKPINETFLDFIGTKDKEGWKTLKSGDIYTHENISYQPKYGFLTKDGKTTLYHVDYEWSNADHSNDILLKDIHDVQPYLSNNKLFIQALYGCGKTHHIIEPILEEAKRLNQSALIVTESNRLNRQYANIPSLSLSSHLDTVDSTFQVCSLESLPRLTTETYNVLILDEFYSLMNHYNSSTMNNKEVGSIKKLLQYIASCRRCVVCDADLNNTRYTDILNRISPTREIIRIHTEKYDAYTYHIYYNTEQMETLLSEALLRGEKVIGCCDTKTRVDALYLKYKQYTTLTRTSDGCYLNGQKMEHTTLMDKDLNAFLFNHNVQLFIHSPTIKTGVSINGNYFDRQFGYASGNSVSAREFSQMIHRARLLTYKDIWIFTHKPKPNAQLITMEQVLEDMDISNDLYNTLTQIQVTDRPLLKRLCAESKLEQCHSTACFTTELYKIFKYHSFNIELHPTYIPRNEEAPSRVASSWVQFVNTPFPQHDELQSILIKKKKRDLDQIDELSKEDMIVLEVFKLLLNGIVYYAYNNEFYKHTFYGIYPLDTLEGIHSQLWTKPWNVYLDEPAKTFFTAKTIQKYFKFQNRLIEPTEHIKQWIIEHTIDKHNLDSFRENVSLWFMELFLSHGKSCPVVNFTHTHLEYINTIRKKEQKKLLNIKDTTEILFYIGRLTDSTLGCKYIMKNKFKPKLGYTFSTNSNCHFENKQITLAEKKTLNRKPTRKLSKQKSTYEKDTFIYQLDYKHQGKPKTVAVSIPIHMEHGNTNKNVIVRDMKYIVRYTPKVKAYYNADDHIFDIKHNRGFQYTNWNDPIVFYELKQVYSSKHNLIYTIDFTKQSTNYTLCGLGTFVIYMSHVEMLDIHNAYEHNRYEV